MASKFVPGKEGTWILDHTKEIVQFNKFVPCREGSGDVQNHNGKIVQFSKSERG